VSSTRHPEVVEADGPSGLRIPSRPDASTPWFTPTAVSSLLRTVCSCSLGQITHALYEVGGQYRRSM